MRLLLLLSLSYSASATSSSDAVNQAALAFYKYEQWDKDVDEIFRNYEKRLTKDEKQAVSTLAFVVNAIIGQRVTFSYRF